MLIERTNTSAGENNFKPKKNFYENRFILGQFYFESVKNILKSNIIFVFSALYQLFF